MQATRTLGFGRSCRAFCTRLVQIAALAAALAGARGCASLGHVSAPPETAGAQPTEDVRIMIGEARDRVFPALVHVDVVAVENFGGKKQKQRFTGSGTIISPEGYVLTNAHVTNKGVNYWCTLADKRRVPAKLVGEDPLTDLAVLRLDMAAVAAATPGAGSGPGALPVAKFGDSARLQVGDYVLAMGSPFALSRTVTLGVVSNTERVFTSGLGEGEMSEMMLDSDQRTGLFTTWIQHDALINPGNSGGPLVNLGGEVVGVNTRGGSGLAFATPSNLARQVAATLIKDGEIKRSWIGVSFRHIEDTGLPDGVLVNSVDIDGPAQAAGLRAGDVVRSINGQPVTVRFVEQIPPLLKSLADMPIGSSVEVGYRRDGQDQTTTVVTKELLRDRGDETALREWGLTAQQITPQIARQWQILDPDGVLVNSTRSGGPAETAEPALSAGDVIRSVDGQRMKTMADLIAFYKKMSEMKDKPEYVLIEYDRHGKNYLTLLKPKPDERENPPPEIAKAWIGVATQAVLQNLAEKMGPPNEPGFRITRVYAGTRAADSGLKVGDLVIALDGDRLKPRGMQDAGLFARAVRKLSIDDQASLGVLRGTEKVTISVPLERTRLTPEEAKRERNTDFEMVIREITFFDRDEHQWKQDVAGVVIDQVESAGWAGLGGLHAGDLIQRIDGKPIGDPTAYKETMEAIKTAKPERVVFVVLRGIKTYFKFVEPEWGPGADDKAKNGNDKGAGGAPKPGDSK